MDLLVPKVGEIIGGSQREERLDVLQHKMRAFDILPASLDWYLDTRRWGSCPHAGFGLGFERFLMYITGMENVRDVIPFPRTPGNARF
jgi:asparaginyl-tRNA synthetase